MSEPLEWKEFARVEMRVGTIIEAESFAEAHNPSIKMEIDFGPLGIKKSSAQITDNYKAEELVGRQVIAVVNFPPKQIGPLMSECLVLGAEEPDGVILLQPERKTTNGTRIG